MNFITLLNLAALSPLVSSMAFYAVLEQLNSTSLSLTITNSNPVDAIVFAQNSVFDGAVQESVLLSGAVNGTEAPLQLGEDAIFTTYLSVASTDLITIKAYASWETSFDITKFYQVPQAGLYVASFQGLSILVTDPSDLSAAVFQDAQVTSPPLTVELTASATPTSARKRQLGKRTWTNSNCNSADKQVVKGMLSLAQHYANDGAAFVSDVAISMGLGTSHPVWDEYFNNADTRTVLRAFAGVAKLDFPKYENLDIYCRSYLPMKAERCNRGNIAGYAKDDPPSITLCPAWFELPESSNCDAKAPSVNNQQIFDQPSVILHEMLHVKRVAKADIRDGPDGTNLYSYTDVHNQALAQSVKQTNGPQNTVSAYIFFLYGSYKLERQTNPTRYNNARGFGTCVDTPYRGSGEL